MMGVIRVEISPSAVDEGGPDELLLALGPDDKVTIDGVPIHGIVRIEIVGADD